MSDLRWAVESLKTLQRSRHGRHDEDLLDLSADIDQILEPLIASLEEYAALIEISQELDRQSRSS